MKKLFILLVGLISLGFCSFGVANAQANQVDLVLFYGEGCTYCSKAQVYLDDLQKEYPSLNVIEYEVYNDQENYDLLDETAFAYGVEVKGVPTIFINNDALSGFNDSTVSKIKGNVEYCIENECTSPLNQSLVGDGNDSLKNFIAPVVFVLITLIIVFFFKKHTGKKR
ncbi:thioredoxin family protein [Candidatus Peregrinibacteria bacterium]|jgi:thiol-disulfide isomerase/thioredoxin|nr:thioredoxin family protein [Candidatus Peregrinibacteria bacterium]